MKSGRPLIMASRWETYGIFRAQTWVLNAGTQSYGLKSFELHLSIERQSTQTSYSTQWLLQSSYSLVLDINLNKSVRPGLLFMNDPYRVFSPGADRMNADSGINFGSPTYSLNTYFGYDSGLPYPESQYGHIGYPSNSDDPNRTISLLSSGQDNSSLDRLFAQFHPIFPSKEIVPASSQLKPHSCPSANAPTRS